MFEMAINLIFDSNSKKEIKNTDYFEYEIGLKINPPTWISTISQPSKHINEWKIKYMNELPFLFYSNSPDKK